MKKQVNNDKIGHTLIVDDNIEDGVDQDEIAGKVELNQKIMMLAMENNDTSTLHVIEDNDNLEIKKEEVMMANPDDIKNNNRDDSTFQIYFG